MKGLCAVEVVVFVALFVLSHKHLINKSCVCIRQAHIAVEGSPVIQKYLESLAQGDVKVSLSGFQRWSLGQQQ